MKQHLIALLFCLAIAGSGHAQINQIENIIEKGIELYDAGDYEAAKEQYRQALKLNPLSPEANYELALTSFASKDMPSTVRYSDVVIKQKSAEPEIRAQAHVIKGSALDVTGQQDKAIKEYKKAIKLAPQLYQPYYNLALTLYNQKNYMEAEQALMKSLKLKPGHSSSHLLMGYTKQAQQQRVQSMLALYNFLLLEPSSERAVSAYELLRQMQAEGVSKTDGNSTNILVSADRMNNNPFSAAELMLSMTQAAHLTEGAAGKTSQQLFNEKTVTFFSTLGELKKDQQDFWWNYYVEFFHDMLLDKNVEALSYYISQSKSEAAAQWLKDHPEKVEELISWNQNYKR